MRKRGWASLILLFAMVTGCGAHLPTPLTAGRQVPMVSPHGGISIPLNRMSEVQLNLRGCRLGLTAQADRRDVDDSRPDLTPWLRYRLHF